MLHKKKRKRIAVLGAGIQGSCTALELADRGHEVDLYDKEEMPLTKASLWNEGKIHLGFTYANDPSKHTAARMIRGSLGFWDDLSRWIDLDDSVLSDPFNYIVHKDSLLNVETVDKYFSEVSELYKKLKSATGKAYLNQRSKLNYEKMDDSEIDEKYNRAHLQAVFRTPERSVDPQIIARKLRASISTHDLIRFKGGQQVNKVESQGSTLSVCSETNEQYDHVINALWYDRLRIDQSFGISHNRPWLHRYKLAIHLDEAGDGENIPSTTMILGSFGDVVRFRNGKYYLSWYPSCLLSTTKDLSMPEKTVGESTRITVLEESFNALAEIVPGIKGLNTSQANVEGGAIFSWGKTDISDPTSELHTRFDIGIRSCGNYHTIDTGKYCMAPTFAVDMANRIEAS